MTTGRAFRIAGAGARLLGGALIAVAAVGVTVAGVAFSWPTRTATPVAVTVTPAPADTVLTCAGPLLALGRDPSAAAGLSVAADGAITMGAPDAAAAPASAALPTSGVNGSPGATRLSAAPTGRTAAPLAAATSAAVSADDLSGFAASACAPALTESWLVGGATTTGSADLVLLANPGDVTASVDLTVYGAQGRIVPAGAAGLVVPPRTQRVFPLSGIGLGQEAPVVRVTASGSPVQAVLQSSVSQTLVPIGVEQEGVIASSARTQVIPGVRVVVASGNDPTTVVRLVSPTTAVTATITVTAADGRVVATRTAPLPAASPAEVELDGLATGFYSVSVTAPSPVVAAVWQATGTGAGSDFAWFTAAPRLAAPTLVAVPDGPSARLAVTNSGNAAASVVLEPLHGGTPTTLQVAPGATVTAPVTAGSTYRLDPGATPVTASVSFSGPGALSAFAVWPADAAAAPIVVHP